MKRLHGWIARLLCLSVTAVFITTAFTVKSQNLYVKVGAQYGVSAADDGKRVSDKYATGQDTLPTGLYWAWQRWKAEGMPYATFRSRYLGCAIAKDIAWRYEAASNIKSGYQNTFAFADWTDASGHWYANATMQIPRGGMVGQGSFGHYDNTQTSQIFATCEFQMTEDWWPATATERRLFETPNSSLGTPDNGSYNESFRIEGFRLTGPGVYGDGVNRIGLFIRRPGECSYVNQVFAQMFQYGIMVVGGVPFTFGTLTAFWNEKVGVALMGGWGATFSGQTISGDSNGELFGSHPGYGDEAGGIISIGLLKNEDGILGEAAQAPWRGQITAYIEGQYTASIGASACSRNWITTDAAFVVNPRLTNGSPQASVLRVGPTKGFNFRTAMHNLATGTRWAAPGDYQGFAFDHYAQGDRMVMNGQAVAGTACACPPLGFFRGNGTFDYTACLPARVGATNPGPVNPPPPPVDPPPPPPASTMTATASVNNVPAELAKITDGNAGTAWLSKVAMKPGDWVMIDYGTTATRSSVAFDIASGYTNSFPGSFDVYVSKDGTSFGNPVKVNAPGGYPTCTANFTPVSFRFAKMVVKTVNPAGSNWLAIQAWR